MKTPTWTYKYTLFIMQMSCYTHQTFLSKTFTNSLNMQKQYEKMFGKQVMTRIVVGKSTDHDKPHFDLFFYHNINVKENVFLQSAS